MVNFAIALAAAILIDGLAVALVAMINEDDRRWHEAHGDLVLPPGPTVKQALRTHRWLNLEVAACCAICYFAGRGILAHHGWAVGALPYAMLGFALILIGLVDYRSQLVPNRVVFPMMVAGLVVNAVPAIRLVPLESALLGLAIGWGALFLIAYVYARIRGFEGLGRGDMKLIGMLGSWIGAAPLPFILVLASLTAIMVQTLRILAKRAGWHDAFAFGPAICGVAVAIVSLT